MADPVGYAIAYSKYKTYKTATAKKYNGRPPDVSKRIAIAKKLNEAGLSNLREYCTMKKWPVRDFDKQIKIVVHALKFGQDACVTKFSISRQYADHLLDKYAQYADECILRKEETDAEQ